MIRTGLGALLGWLVGIGLTAGLLVATERVIRWLSAPRIFEIEYGAIYLAVVLGSGFGALSGALVGAAGAVLRRGQGGLSRAEERPSPD